MSKAAPVFLSKLAAAGDIDGVISLGGGGGTAISTAAMRALPLGFPKLMVSTLAAGNTAPYLGTKDIVMMPSIADVAGLNRLSRLIFSRAAGAICGMVEAKVETDGSRPLVAVQRYGLGRAMVFTGEASWRWRMQMPSEDRTYELFWRQVARWLSTGAPEPVSVTTPIGVEPRTADALHLDVRDSAFAPVTDAQVTMRVTLPGGDVQDLRPALADPRAGRYSAEQRFEQPGIYRIAAEARRGAATLGSADRWLLVGGADREMTDPRLNEDVLRRLAGASGGEYLTRDTISRLPSLLDSAAPEPQAPRLQELWQTPWIFAAIILLLGAEWVLRRRWGLR